MSASETAASATTPTATGTKTSTTSPNLSGTEPQAASTREVGNQATWSLSSCKPGFGVEQLRDDNFETYWQSDGQLPHLVNIQFKRKTTVSSVGVYTDFRYMVLRKQRFSFGIVVLVEIDDSQIVVSQIVVRTELSQIKAF
jgi:hypothetical protein